MKTLLLALMCTLTLVAYAGGETDPETTLTVTGAFINKKNVSYEVSLVNSDMSRTPLETRKGVFNYEVNLEIGKIYLIKFIKGDLVKELRVVVTEPGIMELNVDFSSSGSAKLNYDVCLETYIVKPLIEPNYAFR